jgi:hypothetical protein
LLTLAEADVLDSNFERARAFSQQASFELARYDDPENLAEALCVESYCASSLGLGEAANDATQRCQDLARHQLAANFRAKADNYAGVAAFWSGDLATANKALRTSMQFALESDAPAEVFHPLTNLCFTEMLSVNRARYLGQDHDLAQLTALILQCQHLLNAGHSATFKGWTMVVGHMLMGFLNHQAAIMRGKHEEADRGLAALRKRGRHLHPRSWLHALVWWAELVQAQAAHETRKALFCGRAMAHAAKRAQHRPMQTIALQATRGLAAISLSPDQSSP